MELKNGIKTIRAKTRKAWRQWLLKNHALEKSVWLIIYHKQISKSSVYYEEAVEEAICFGWVDSKPNKRDDRSYYLFMARRNANSNWSRANRERADKMMAEGLMTPAGQKMIDLAKEKGHWTALDQAQDAIIPDDLQRLLIKNKAAARHFEAFPPSSKRIILEWILNAKKPETRVQRITRTVELAAKNIRANHYRQS